jgi:hypothetical protein
MPPSLLDQQLAPVLPAMPVSEVPVDDAPVLAPVLPVPWLAVVGPQLVRLLLSPPLPPALPELEESLEPLDEEPELEPEESDEPDEPEPAPCAMAEVARPRDRAVTARILVIMSESSFVLFIHRH